MESRYENLGLKVPGKDLLCNAKIKTYPDGSAKIVVFDKMIFVPEGWENDGKKRYKSLLDETSPGESCQKEDCLKRARRRAKEAVRDIALSNDMKHFVTLTIDQKELDRYDIGAITHQMKIWLSNQVQRRDLLYILVPERHRDGAIHFHGLFGGEPGLEAVASGTWTDGKSKPRRPQTAKEAALFRASENWHEVFNLPRWKYGFTTAIKLYGDKAATIGYILKYLDKQYNEKDGDHLPGKIGGRWYYSGGNLRRPNVEYCELFDWEMLDGYEFTVPEAGLRGKIIQIAPDGTIMRCQNVKS